MTSARLAWRSRPGAPHHWPPPGLAPGTSRYGQILRAAFFASGEQAGGGLEAAVPQHDGLRRASRGTGRRTTAGSGGALCRFPRRCARSRWQPVWWTRPRSSRPPTPCQHRHPPRLPMRFHQDVHVQVGTASAISVSSATHPEVVHRNHRPGQPVTGASRDQFTRDRWHVRKRRVPPTARTRRPTRSGCSVTLVPNRCGLELRQGLSEHPVDGLEQ